MARYVDNHTGTHVYDDDTDTWYKFEDEHERDAFLNYAETGDKPLIEGAPAPMPVLMVVQPKDDTITEERGAPTYATFNMGIASAVGNPFQVLGDDINRREVRLKFIATAGTVIIGAKAGILVGQGFVMSNGDTLTLESTDELWCAGFTTPLTAANLSVLVVTNTTH